MILTYIAFFGIRIDIGDTNTTNKCKQIEAPVLLSPVNVPVIDKSNIENKEYVIKVLIKHIKDQNNYINKTNIQTTEIYNSYKSCVIN